MKYGVPANIGIWAVRKKGAVGKGQSLPGRSSQQDGNQEEVRLRPCEATARQPSRGSFERRLAHQSGQLSQLAHPWSCV